MNISADDEKEGKTGKGDEKITTLRADAFKNKNRGK